MASRARSAAHVVALLSASLAPLAAHAQPAGSDASNVAGGDGAVLLTVSGPDDAALRDSIRELLARLNLTVTSAGDVGAAAPIARVQIDLGSPTDALVVVLDGATGEVRLRRSMPRDASSAIVREEIAHAVQSAVESALLAAREHPAPAPEPPPPPAPEPVIITLPAPPEAKEQPPPPPRPSRFGLEITTLAGVGPIADGSGPGTRIGLGANVVSRGFLRPSFSLAFLYAVPFDTGDVELTSHTSIASGRALVGLGLLRSRWIALDLGAGGGVDAVTVSSHSGSLPLSAINPQTTRADALLSAMATAQVALAPGVVFLLTAGVDVDLDSRQYVLKDGTTESDRLDPWRVRPMALAGFGFTALGDGHFVANGGR